MNKALFLDRDGVINVDKHYLHLIEEFEFIDGIFDLVSAAKQAGYLIIVITNQSGIGRGYYTEQAYQDLTAWMLDQFHTHSCDIDAVYHCPYHPTKGVGEFKQDHPCRKPNPGMILQACSEHHIAPENSIIIGDKMSDIEAGRSAGIRQLVLYAPASVADSKATPAAFSSLKAITGHLFSPG